MKKLLILWVAVILTLLGSSLLAREPLSFDERVKAQEAIEKVYYNHRIWPKENKTPKPAFEKMVSKETIENKVTDYLQKSAALEKYWYRPITGEQLQAEMDRMAKGTKDPATLNELFAALNNDPYVIAECLARPVLADRLVRNWYANDERFHKEMREKAEEILKNLTTENFCESTEGQYSKMTYRLEVEGREEMDILDPEDRSIKLDEKEFAKMMTEIPEEGKISGVIEKDDFFVVIHTTIKTIFEIEAENRSFTKQNLDEWLESQTHTISLPEIDSYSASLYLPPKPESSCIGNWDNQSLDDLPDPRSYHTAVWTGTEMIVWGGYIGGSVYVNTGGRYNPATDSWTSTTTTGAPSGRNGHTTVWTGSEMIIWGGYNGSSNLNTGGRFNPLTNSWIETINTGAPSGRNGHIAVWTGSEMIVWGGGSGGVYTNTGGRYNPSTNSWMATSTANAPSERGGHTAIWTGLEMIIWGGNNGSNTVNTGGRYNPPTDSWVSTTTTGAPSGRKSHTAVWTGSEMII